jgi:hypothetical protein
MKLERRKFIYQGYYNSTQGYPVPCECVLEYIEPIEAERLELAVERATANMVAAQNRAAELEKALREKDIEIESLRIVLSDCLDHFEHTPTRPIAVAVRKILGGGG